MEAPTHFPARHRKRDEMRPRQSVRVVHLTTVHHASDPRIAHKQLRTLQEAGYEVHLVAPHQRSEVVDEIAFHALPRVDGRYRRVLLHRQAYQAAYMLDAACYHFHDPELIPVAYALKQATGACVIYDMHEDYRWHGPLEGRFIRALEHWCFRWVDHVVLAEASYRTIVAGTGAGATFIGNYVRPYDDTPPPPRTGMASPVRLLYTGVAAESRGLFHMIDLVEHVTGTEDAAVLNMVGVCNLPNERYRAERIIRQCGLDARIRRIGWDAYVPADTMTPHYRWANVGLALFDPDPNHMQSILTKFYEYLHYGLPIVCSDFPRWQRFIERHHCGAVVPPGDVAAVRAVLHRWRTDPARYRALSASARAAASQYAWAVMGERLVRLYDGLLGVGEATE